MENMTRKERIDFLNHGTRTGKISSIHYKDGRPHVAPIWFMLDGDDLIFTTWHESVKAKNFLADNRVSICVDDENPPFHFVIVEGELAIQQTPDLDELKSWATKIARRYMGDDLAEQYGARNGVEGEWLLRLKPNKIIAKKDIAG